MNRRQAQLRARQSGLRAIGVRIILCTAAAAFGEKGASIQFLVSNGSKGRPVRNAEIVVQPVDSNGRAVGQSLELKTHDDGTASVKDIPYGKVQVKVIAPGFKTINKNYDVNQSSMMITIKIQKASNTIVK